MKCSKQLKKERTKHMEQIAAYKALNGEICTDKITCLEKDYRFSLRAIVQRTTKNNTFTGSDFAGIVAANFEEINQVGNRFRNAIRRAKAAQKVTVPTNTMLQG